MKRRNIGDSARPMMPEFATEEGLRRLAWDLFEWAEQPPLSLSAQEQQALARQLLEAADVISALRAAVDVADKRVVNMARSASVMGWNAAIEESSRLVEMSCATSEAGEELAQEIRQLKKEAP